jgi:flagellar biosynthetic protein FlhB
VVARLRHLALAVAWPLGTVLLGATAAAVAAHQLQVGGLWVPALLAPDPARLWAFGRPPGLASRAARATWGLVKAVLIAALVLLALRTFAPRWHQLGNLEPRALGTASATALRQFTLTLAAATLALGLVDFALQHRRFQALLQMTPEQQREDLRSMEGDPALRAQRRRIARAWRSSPGEVLNGAACVLTGTAGLTLIVAGGLPPRRFMIRSVVRGAPGLRLREAASRAGVREVSAPDLARRLARRPAPALPLSTEEAAELAAVYSRSQPEPSPSGST